MRGGALLAPEAKERLRAINAELASPGTKVGDNLLKEMNAYRLVVDNHGGPRRAVRSGSWPAPPRRPRRPGSPGKWVFTLHGPSIWPFLESADNRELRRQIFTAYTTRGDHGERRRQQGRSWPASPRCAPRRRQAARLRHLGRLRARRQHGEDPGAGLRAAQPAVGPGQGGRGQGGRRPAGRDQGRRQGLQARAVGLVLLHREGPQGPLRPRRGRRCARTSSSRTSATAPSRSPTSCTASPSPS